MRISHSVITNSMSPNGPTLWDPLEPTRLLCPWNSPGKNIGVGSHSLLQGIFLTQGSNLGLLYCRWILYHLSHQGSPQKTHLLILPTNSLARGSVGAYQADERAGVARLCCRVSGRWAGRGRAAPVARITM